MELLLYAKDYSGNKLTHSRDDIIIANPDGFAWGNGELDTSIFSIVTVPDTIENLEYIGMLNLQARYFSTAYKIPALRGIATCEKGLKLLSRRKFKYNPTTGKIERKNDKEY